MSIFKICKICTILYIGVLSINNNIGYTMQEQKNTEVIQTHSDYEVIQVIEFDWNTIPIMFERSPDSYIQGRYIQVSNDYNKYICDIWSHEIRAYTKIGNKLDYEDETVINKFTELSNRIRIDHNWNNVNNIIHELFGDKYSVLLY